MADPHVDTCPYCGGAVRAGDDVRLAAGHPAHCGCVEPHGEAVADRSRSLAHATTMRDLAGAVLAPR